MSLINCPECNKQISDKAISCPHCGYPINNRNQIGSDAINDTNYDVILTDYLRNDKIKSIKAIRDVCPLDLYDAKRAIEKIPCLILKNIEYSKAQNIKFKMESSGLSVNIVPSNTCFDTNVFDLSVISCPHCGSTAVTTGQRGFSFLTGFLGSNKTVNRCGKCGWTWQPK